MSSSIVTEEGLTFRPFIALNGIWDFEGTGQLQANGQVVGKNLFRGRAVAGFGAQTPDGTQISLDGFYDGIGTSKLEAYGGTLGVAIPLN